MWFYLAFIPEQEIWAKLLIPPTMGHLQQTHILQATTATGSSKQRDFWRPRADNFHASKGHFPYVISLRAAV